ncbi:hypothetical protein ONZ45_g18517 [Pleurotus djamor]|nr:hypothetical protein ONZ45_g18517 [Pleurotus djamor]
MHEDLTVRVYLVPYDLPNVKGTLQMRPTNILAPARRYLKSLLATLSSENNFRLNFLSLLDDSQRMSTLSQIYSQLPSPVPSLEADAPQISLALLDYDFDVEHELGLRSKLYKYQRRTVAQLIQRESTTSPIPDPLYIPLRSDKGDTFYFQPGTYEVLRECPRVVSTPGGILCEELGTGKTVMILSLILASRYDPSTPEEALTDIRPVLTPVALRHFPSYPFDPARQRAHITHPLQDGFTAEEKNKDMDKLHKRRPCNCPHFNHSQARIPRCTCPDPPVSPLLQIRWKRLVIDEGHVSSSLNTLLTPFVKLLSIQSKWIVTGTPTTNLLGLNFGSSSVQEHELSNANLDEAPGDVGDILDDDQPLESLPSQLWTSTDRADLQKFGAMLTHFIGTPQFLSNPNLYKIAVVEALMDVDGPRPGALQVLTQLMSSCMVRHRISDIEQETTLPPLRTDTILLDLEPMAAKSYNAMQATIVINAVDSQRTDQDYLFHPRNAKSLQVTIANLSQIMFWGTSEDLYNVVELLRTAEAQIERAKERGISVEDMQMLQDALAHVKIAADDLRWRVLQKNPEVPFQITGMQDEIFDAWSGARPFVQDPNAPKLMHPLHLIRLKQALSARPLAPLDWLLEVGREMHAAEQETTPSKAPTIRNISTHPTSPSFLLRKSPLAHVQVGCSASSKLNYIINEALQYSSTEKILIFSQSPFTLALIKDAMDLLEIRCAQFVAGISARRREEQVVTFETSETYRVFLMELRHGARGLNLISASRVIFCEPVWRADVESQAIKRVHRIGQTKPVHVKTLVIRGTAEEHMMSRRSELWGSSTKIPNMIEEQGMRYFIMVGPSSPSPSFALIPVIQHPRFINTPPVSLPTVTFPLLNFNDNDTSDIQEATGSTNWPSVLDFAKPPTPPLPPTSSSTVSPVKRRKVTLIV